MLETTYEYIVIDDNGVAWIENANMKLVELVLSHQAYGGTLAELQTQHPGLTLSQIYSAFAYYEDHRQAVDGEIDQRYQRAEQMRRNTPGSPGLEKLRQAKRDGTAEC